MFLNARIRSRIPRCFPGLFPKLFSTLDNPIEVPVEVEAYKLALRKYLQDGGTVLDVGFGIGFGMRMLSEKASWVAGVEVDKKTVRHAQK